MARMVSGRPSEGNLLPWASNVGDFGRMARRDDGEANESSLNSPHARRQRELATRAELKRRGIEVIDGELSVAEKRDLAESFKRDHPEVLASIRSKTRLAAKSPKDLTEEAWMEDELAVFHAYCSKVGVPRLIDAGKAFDDIVDACLNEAARAR